MNGEMPSSVWSSMPNAEYAERKNIVGRGSGKAPSPLAVRTDNGIHVESFT